MGNTRRLAAGMLLAILVLSSGCIGFLVGNDTLSFTATGTTVDDRVLSDTGYERTADEHLTFNRSFEQAGQTRRVEITTQLTRYEKSVDLGPAGRQDAAAFMVLTTPQVQVASHSFDPISTLDRDELVEQFATRYGSVEEVERVGSRTVTVFGSDAEVTTFEATTTIAGESVDISIHVTQITHKGESVVAVAVHPTTVDEETNVDTLLESLEHGE